MLRKVVVPALALGLLAASPASAATSRFGHTGAPDRVLRSGCHDYHHRYVVDAPTHDWVLETSLIDPTGERLGSGAFISDSDPERGQGVFRLCRQSTRPGTFKIRAKLHWYDGYDAHRVYFKKSYFRLTRS